MTNEYKVIKLLIPKWSVARNNSNADNVVTVNY